MQDINLDHDPDVIRESQESVDLVDEKEGELVKKAEEKKRLIAEKEAEVQEALAQWNTSLEEQRHISNPKRRIRCLSTTTTSSHSQPSIDVATKLEIPASTKLWLHNTMSRKKELFKPKIERKVDMYVCGVIPYDLSHIGHARVYITFDVLYRYLRHLGYQVTYVRNFTDVDDKIIATANEKGEDPISLSGRYCEMFKQDMEYLNCLRPSVEPRVSDHMPQIVEMIDRIIINGHAYEVDGDVYFSVDKFPDYGRLSGRKLEDNRAGERVPVDSRKKNPADFALWKSAKEGEPFWKSPWSPGRPGWHIECSAMSAAYLGDSFDIHGGGMDLVFPHHENEMAQSCATCKQSDISYWIHNGFVTIDSEKMSNQIPRELLYNPGGYRPIPSIGFTIFLVRVPLSVSNQLL